MAGPSLFLQSLMSVDISEDCVHCMCIMGKPLCITYIRQWRFTQGGIKVFVFQFSPNNSSMLKDWFNSQWRYVYMATSTFCWDFYNSFVTGSQGMCPQTLLTVPMYEHKESLRWQLLVFKLLQVGMCIVCICFALVTIVRIYIATQLV